MAQVKEAVETYTYVYAVEDCGRKSCGYVFLSKGGDVCGLAVGMLCRTEEEEPWYRDF